MTAQTPLFDTEASLEEEPRAPTWPPAGRTGPGWWMGWLEDRPNTPMEQLLGEAAAHFTRKFRLAPTHALVPLGWEILLVDAEGKALQTLPQFPGLKIHPSRMVQKGHVWLSHLPDPEYISAQCLPSGA